VVLLVGTVTAFAMALIGLVQHDIKRVVAYSTLSQLGYMTASLGASAYAAGIFHLGTHAFFKALLFLAAGSVIIAMHHEQDMRHMGGLRRSMPVTALTAWVGSLALAGLPPFAGFFSKDAIIEAVHASGIPGAGLAWLLLMAGVFVTSFYTFRLMFLTFYGKPRMERDTFLHVKESPWTVTLPLVLLAIPSVLAGALYMEPMLFGGYFGEAIKVLPAHDVLGALAHHNEGLTGLSLVVQKILHGLFAAPFWLALAGLVLAYVFYIQRPELPDLAAGRLRALHTVLMRKYGFDEFYEHVFAGGARAVGNGFWRLGDVRLIDGWMVNGTARVIGWTSSVVRLSQSGYVYHYAFAMIIGLFLLMTFFLRP
jgi:NADH-quinone oxidoreductase subunit L